MGTIMHGDNNLDSNNSSTNIKETYSGKAAIVTGASRGIGRAIAIGLAKAGYNIAGVGRKVKSDNSGQGLIEMQCEIESQGVDFLPLQMDIADICRHKSVVADVINKFGRIDILVNNAGIAPAERKDVLETTVESYNTVMNVNLRGAFFLTQIVSNIMINHKEKCNDYCPKIIFITSISAKIPSTNRAEYCMSKAGLSMAAKLFADRLAGEGINVYEIRPGIIETDMTAGVKDKYDKMIAAGLIPQGRWGLPQDVAKVVNAIASGSLDYSAGGIIDVSGGMNIGRL